MKPRPRIAVVGAGWVVQRAYVDMLEEHVATAVVHDADPARAAALAARLRCRVAPDVSECWGPDVDGVLFAIPPAEHEPLLAPALAAGRHLLCEKPVTRSNAHARGLVANGARLMGSATTRLRVDVHQLITWIREGRLGAMRRIACTWRRGAGVPAPGSWRTDARLAPGGVLDDLGPHLLDVVVSLVAAEDRFEVIEAMLTHSSDRAVDGARWFAAEPADRGGNGLGDRAPDTVHARLRSESGIDVDLDLSWCDGGVGDVSSIAVEGDRGTATLEGLFGYSNERRLPFQRCRLRAHGGARTVDYPPGPQVQHAAFGDSVARFAAFCRGDAEPIASFHDVSRVGDLIEQIQHWSPG